MDDVAETVVCGPDVERWAEQAAAYAEAGFDHLYFHQVGRDQEGFFRFWQKELGPRLAWRAPAIGTHLSQVCDTRVRVSGLG